MEERELYLERNLVYDKKPTKTELQAIKRIYTHELASNIGLLAQDPNTQQVYKVVRCGDVETKVVDRVDKAGYVVLVHGVAYAQEQKNETDTKTEKQE